MSIKFLAACIIFNIVSTGVGNIKTVGDSVYKQPSSSVTYSIDENAKRTFPAKLQGNRENITYENYPVHLKKLGFVSEEYPDGELNLRNALLRFQASHNLEVDGVCGENTLAALEKRVYDPDFVYTDKLSGISAQGKLIVVNKDKKLLTLYENNSVIKKYPVALGNPPSLTPEGKFSIVVKVINPAWGGGGYAQPVPGGVPENPLGYRWLGLSLNGGGDYGIHGNNSPYSIGLFVSHGCIRMINSDAEELFQRVDTGIPVWIGSDSLLSEWGISQPRYVKNPE